MESFEADLIVNYIFRISEVLFLSVCYINYQSQSEELESYHAIHRA